MAESSSTESPSTPISESDEEPIIISDITDSQLPGRIEEWDKERKEFEAKWGFTTQTSEDSQLNQPAIDSQPKEFNMMITYDHVAERENEEKCPAYNFPNCCPQHLEEYNDYVKLRSV